jgi:hypothetical protein
VGAELFQADGQTDMTKLTVAFRNFANAPKNGKSSKFLINFVSIAKHSGDQVKKTEMGR